MELIVEIVVQVKIMVYDGVCGDFIARLMFDTQT